VGLFEAASGGTLFLDEIASMPVDLQSRLLRVLEEKKVRRVGDTHERRVNVRIVVAANIALEELVSKDQFRSDLYYRLNVCQLKIPPLRERLSDLRPLVDHFLNSLAETERFEKRLSSEALARLSLHDFPGNVRELRNIIESAYHLSRGSVIPLDLIEDRLRDASIAPTPGTDSFARRIADRLAAGKACFWETVRDPFLARDLSRKEVREIIAIGLAATHGNYRKLVEYFHIDPADYRRLLSFLTHHDCKVDFRPFRPAR
jgi:two-component system nitrogen regulation response regulator GlnG